MAELLYGRNAVRECLRARRRHIHRLILAQGLQTSPVVNELQRLAAELKVPVQHLPRARLDKQTRGHQGVALEVGRYPLVDLDQIVRRVEKLQNVPLLLALDHLEDPQNLGAILRTAEAVGVDGVILPGRRAAGITPAVSNASAGAAEHLWIATVPNLVRTLRELKAMNVWVVGVEATETAQAYHAVDLNLPLVLVVGNEGQGLSRLVRETCDLLIRFPMRGRVESLNASVAAGLALYEAWRARRFRQQR
ncbi:MAG: 23S rRNA (guanosine(2251)-2'-O)-methyltransferase RlmB [Anaerolineae bacterium]